MIEIDVSSISVSAINVCSRRGVSLTKFLLCSILKIKKSHIAHEVTVFFQDYYFGNR